MSHNFNCFEIQNADHLADHLKASHRLVDVDGPFDQALGDGELAESNLQQLVKQVAILEQIPVAIVEGGEKPVLAIPATHSLGRSEFNLAPDVATLAPRLDDVTLDFSNLSGERKQVALAFLGWYIRGALRQDRRIWNASPWVNFYRRPLNYKHDNRDVDVFRGFGLRLRVLDGRSCVWVRLTHKYVETDWLNDLYSDSDVQQQLRMKHALYHYGHRRFPVQLLGPVSQVDLGAGICARGCDEVDQCLRLDGSGGRWSEVGAGDSPRAAGAARTAPSRRRPAVRRQRTA